MKMSDKEIKALLQRYMDGMTSLEEEAMLTRYFSKAGNRITPEGIAEKDWQAYKEMFAMFAPKRNKVGIVWLWRCAAVAAVVLLVVAGAGVWLESREASPMDEGGYVAVAEKTDSILIDVVADTMKSEMIHQDKIPAVKKKSRKQKYPRYEPSVPRHYMAQNAPKSAETEIDAEEALRQAELLMQAVYLQQQSDVNNAMMQCTLVIEEEEY